MKVQILTLLFLVLAPLGVSAQETDAEYRQAVKELIIANDESKLANYRLISTNANNIAAPINKVVGDESKADEWAAEFWDDEGRDTLVNAFQQYCGDEISYIDVLQLKEDLPYIKLHAISGITEVTTAFAEARLQYMKGKFEGFKEPECSETYKELFDRYYKQYLQKRYDGERDYVVKHLSAPKQIRQAQRFYKENARPYAMMICHRYISERDLEKMLEVLRREKFSFVSEQGRKHAEDLNRRLSRGLTRWLSKKIQR